MEFSQQKFPGEVEPFVISMPLSTRYSAVFEKNQSDYGFFPSNRSLTSWMSLIFCLFTKIFPWLKTMTPGEHPFQFFTIHRSFFEQKLIFFHILMRDWAMHLRISFPQFDFFLLKPQGPFTPRDFAKCERNTQSFHFLTLWTLIISLKVEICSSIHIRTSH